MKFGYKFLNNDLPVEIMNCAKNDHKGKSLVKIHRYNTRNKYVLNLPIAKNSKYLSSIFCKGNASLMQLPDHIKNIKNYFCFVCTCKKFLLETNS